MNRQRCTIGHCKERATRRLEIRRAPEDRHPAEVRFVCVSPLCMRIARQTVGGFHHATEKDGTGLDIPQE